MREGGEREERGRSEVQTGKAGERDRDNLPTAVSILK